MVAISFDKKTLSTNEIFERPQKKLKIFSQNVCYDKAMMYLSNINLPLSLSCNFVAEVVWPS